jgi:hypothetical protein
MQKMIAVDRLARPDQHILVPIERIREARIDQGLLANNVMPFEGISSRDGCTESPPAKCRRWKRRAHAVRFPDAPWSSQLDGAPGVG